MSAHTQLPLGMTQIPVATLGKMHDRIAQLEADAARWRALVAKFGNEIDLATPGKQHDIVIRMNADGCEVLAPDGSLDFAATIAAIMDDEIRIQSAAESERVTPRVEAV